MAEQRYLTNIDFCRGVLLGLSAGRRDIVELLSPAGYFAAARTFEYLLASDWGLGLRFSINLSKVRGESSEWLEAVAYMQEWGIITDEYDDLEFLIQPRTDDLDRFWFPSQPGSRDLWVQCARVYCGAFVQHLRTHPEPRSA